MGPKMTSRANLPTTKNFKKQARPIYANMISLHAADIGSYPGRKISERRYVGMKDAKRPISGPYKWAGEKEQRGEQVRMSDVPHKDQSEQTRRERLRSKEMAKTRLDQCWGVATIVPN